MTYDPVDTNDDGIVDADVDNQSVSTGKIATAQENGTDLGPNGAGNRTFGTIYENTNPYDIAVTVRLDTDSTNSQHNHWVSVAENAGDIGGKDVRVSQISIDQESIFTQSFRVPAGSFYKLHEGEVNNGATIDYWNERGFINE